MGFNLSCVDEPLVDSAREALTEGDILGIMAYMPSTRQLSFVTDNYQELKEYGVYEEALLLAYIDTSLNFSRWLPDLINFLFEIADKEKLLKCGDPLPGDGPFTIYRGIGGRGPARRIRGISWTGSREKAIWFAKRFSLEKPAVFMATVDKSLVYAYSNKRNEGEFLCKIPDNLKLVRAWPEKEWSQN